MRRIKNFADRIRAAIPDHAKDLRYEWAYIFGAVCPERDIGAALVLPTVNSAMMGLHLEEISRQVQPGHHAIVILDGAGWHKKGGALKIPENISLLALPPYCPELNPVENVWQFLRQNWLAHTVFSTYDDILDACCRAWNNMANQPGRIRSIAQRAWAQVSY